MQVRDVLVAFRPVLHEAVDCVEQLARQDVFGCLAQFFVGLAVVVHLVLNVRLLNLAAHQGVRAQKLKVSFSVHVECHCLLCLLI